MSASQPELPAVSVCPEKNDVSASPRMSEVRSASDVPASAAATPTRALNPELDAAGFVMAYVSSPEVTFAAMSDQVTFVLFVQPNFVASEARTPRTTGDPMIGVRAAAAVAPPGSSRR